MDYHDLYSKHLDMEALSKAYVNSNGHREVKAICPKHSDGDPSLGIDLENGQYYCFGCGYSGNAITFARERGLELAEELKTRMNHGEATIVDDQAAAKPYPIPAEDVNARAEALAQNEDMLRFLREERGLSDDTIRTFQLGWDGERLTMPVADERDNWVNIRRYMPNHQGEAKVISYAKGCGEARLYPLGEVTFDPVVIAEGELDALKLISEGYHAVTVTGGAGTWHEEWGPLFQGKAVAICYDNDKAGRDGAQKVAASLRGYAKSVHVVDWTGQGLEEAEDVTDFFVKHGRSKEDLDKLLNFPKPKRLLWTVGEFLAKKAPARPCLIGDQILPVESCCVVGGQPKVGKSLFVLQMAMDLALGRPFLGEHAVPEPARVVYLQGELSDDQMEARLGQLTKGLTPEAVKHFRDQVLLRKDVGTFKLDNRVQADQLSGELAELGDVRVLIVDPLIKFHSLDENSASEMQSLFDVFDKLRARLGISVVIVHHHGHGRQDRDGASKLRGSSALFGYIDTGLTLDGTSKAGTVKLTFELRNGANPDPAMLHRDPDTLLYSVADSEANRKVSRKHVVSHLKTVEGEIPRKDLVQLLSETCKASAGTVEAAIKAAEEEGLIGCREGSGRGNPKFFWSLN